jgi:hypothetical protein
MAGRTPFACLAILAVLVTAALFAPTALAGYSCTSSEPSCYPLSVSKSGPSYVNAGQSATYTFQVHNNTGFDTFSDVSVSDDQCSPLSGPEGDSNSDGKLDYTETWTYTCTYAPPGDPGDAVTNTVTASGTGEEYGSVSDTDSHTTWITGLSVDKTVDLDTADPFDELHYTITITNNGPDSWDYEGYLYDQGCEDLSSDSENTDGGWFWLEPGESAVYTCHHNYDGEGDYTNEACADAYVYSNQVEAPSIQGKGGDITVCDSATTKLAKHSVSGTVFEDMNADGVRQLGEPPLPGVVVYADKNGNGVRDEGEPFSTSDGQGNYTVEVELGTTTIREEVPGGFTCSFPGGCSYNVDLPKNTPPDPPVLSRKAAARADDPTGKDFGDWRPASVTGTVVSDDNGNGARDSGEGGLAGIAVFADLDGNGILDQGEPSTTSAGNGTYVLGGLKPGSYTVRHVLVQDGRTCTGPAGGCKHDVTLTSGATEANRDFLDNKAAQVVLGARVIAGVARMTGKTGCAWGSGFNARIRGKGMKRVTFKLDGRKAKTITNLRDNRSYKYRVNVRKLGIGAHTVSATVTYRQGRATKTKTIRLTFQICARQVRAPQFTG